MKKNDGFSLIEVLGSTVIISLILVSSFSLLISFSKSANSNTEIQSSLLINSSIVNKIESNPLLVVPEEIAATLFFSEQLNNKITIKSSGYFINDKINDEYVLKDDLKKLFETAQINNQENKETVIRLYTDLSMRQIVRIELFQYNSKTKTEVNLVEGALSYYGMQ